MLSNGDGPACGIKRLLFGQAEQRAGQPARQILQDELLDLLAGPAQPPTEQLDELHRERRLTSHKGQEVAAIDDINLAIGVCGCVGRPRLPVEHRNVAEHLTRTDQVEDRVAALWRGDADLHRAADYRKQAVARIAFGTDRASPLQPGVLSEPPDLVD